MEIQKTKKLAKNDGKGKPKKEIKLLKNIMILSDASLDGGAPFAYDTPSESAGKAQSLKPRRLAKPPSLESKGTGGPTEKPRPAAHAVSS